MANKKKNGNKQYLKLVANKEIDRAQIPEHSEGFGNMPSRPIQREWHNPNMADEFFKAEDFD